MQRPTQIEFFRDLGRRVERRWRAANFEEEHFPEVALEELTATPTHQHTSADEVLDWCARADNDWPMQLEPELRVADACFTLFRGHRMAIEVRFGRDGAVPIHDYAFDGVIQVLEGESLLRSFEFVEDRRYNAQAQTGALIPREARFLGPGETQSIRASGSSIHAFAHVAFGTSAVVVRTSGRLGSDVRRHFYAPGLALEPDVLAPTAQRANQVAGLMVKTRDPLLEPWLSRYLSSAGLRDAFYMLLAVRQASHDPSCVPDVRGERFARVDHHLERAPWGSAVSVALRRERDAMRLGQARTKAASGEARAILTLMINALAPSDVYPLVRRRYPTEDPVAAVFDRLAPLLESKSPLEVQLDARAIASARKLASAWEGDGRVSGESDEDAASALRLTPLAALFPARATI